jgi:ribosomal protein L7/L12
MDNNTILHHIDAINQRLRRLESQMALVSDKVGMPFVDQSTMVPEEVLQLARSNQRLQAIQRYRQLTNASLDEAREVVYSL